MDKQRVIGAYNRQERKLTYFVISSEVLQKKYMVTELSKAIFKREGDSSFYADVYGMKAVCLSKKEALAQGVKPNSEYKVICLSSLYLEGGVGPAFDCYQYDEKAKSYPVVGGWMESE